MKRIIINFRPQSAHPHARNAFPGLYHRQNLPASSGSHTTCPVGRFLVTAVTCLFLPLTAAAQVQSAESAPVPASPALKLSPCKPEVVPPAGETVPWTTWLPSYDQKHAVWIERDKDRFRIVVDGRASQLVDKVGRLAANEDASEVIVDVLNQGKPCALLYQGGKFSIMAGSVMFPNRDDPRWPGLNGHPANLLLRVASSSEVIVHHGKMIDCVYESSVTENGLHVAYIHFDKVSQKWRICVDGRVVHSEPSPKNYQFAGAVAVAPDGNSWFLQMPNEHQIVFNGRVIPMPSRHISRDPFEMSHDGKRLAFGRHIDGAEYPVYSGISVYPKFSGDSKSVVYAAKVGNSHLIVQDGKEVATENCRIDRLIPGPTAQHLAYLTSEKLVVDGSASRLNGTVVGRMCYSPSGERFACVEKRNDMINLRVGQSQVRLPFCGLDEVFMEFEDENHIVLTGPVGWADQVKPKETLLSGMVQIRTHRSSIPNPWVKLICEISESQLTGGDSAASRSGASGQPTPPLAE